MPGGTNRLLVGKLESWINNSIDVNKNRTNVFASISKTNYMA